MTTAAIYARLSSDRRGTGDSVENQIKECKALIASKGWTVGKIYSDNSISATTGALRHDFEQLLTDAPEVVVVWRQERLERGYHDALDRFLLAGCTGYTCDGQVITVENASSELMTRFRSLLSRIEGRQKSERQKLAYRGELERGLPRLSRPVFGNNLDGTLKEVEAKAIRTGAKDFLNKDASLNEIAKRWNATGLRTPFSQSEKNRLNGGKGRGGNPWNHRRLSELFQNERLIGKRTYEGQTVTLVNWTPVLDEETFEHLQVVLAERKTGVRGKKSLPPGSHLLSSILRCAECNSVMVTSYAGGKNNERLYKCQTVEHFDADGNSIGGPFAKNAEKTDAVVVNDFLLTLVSPEAQETLLGDSGNLARLTANRSTMILKHREWMDEALSLEEPPSPSVFAQKEAKHEEALKAINAEILELDKDSLFEGLRWEPKGKGMKQLQDDLVALEAEALARWNAVPMERKRRIIEVFYDKISASRGKRGQRFRSDSVELMRSDLLRKLQQPAD
ncbi:recombinase family protein [Pseudarthrobacter oxydans]|uniref:recombinase family protein n=1 Tax=Pseudarthrobacter oxydans TaxID=1671 RepID=UPI0015741D38|nr:recombinase family protein [Pseudarthrobacter oxydans]NSX39013.1 recombinase family protein [Pseudarthrobacter oxydans]